jgi:chromosome transmission fidelity protein 18
LLIRSSRALDLLGSYGTASVSPAVQTRYAIRQVLSQEHEKLLAKQRSDARKSRFNAMNPLAEQELRDAEVSCILRKPTLVKRDFFGRVVEEPIIEDTPAIIAARQRDSKETKVWCTFHEGFSNAVRKPVTLAELMAGL